MIVADNFLYIANPRTGSQSIHAALRDYGNHAYLPHHAKAKDIFGPNRKYKPQVKDWAKLYKFCFVRNPLDYWVSQYLRSDCWSGRGISFKEMIFGHFEEDAQYHYFLDEKGKLMVDHLGKFQNLRSEFTMICAQIGIKAQLPHLNKSSRRPTHEYYTRDMEQHVRQQFAKDFEWWDK